VDSDDEEEEVVLVLVLERLRFVLRPVKSTLCALREALDDCVVTGVVGAVDVDVSDSEEDGIVDNSRGPEIVTLR
jgi:hypothetical protein